MTYEANKYRIQAINRNLPRQQVKRMTRVQTIAAIARWSKQGHDAFIKDFHQRSMLPEHDKKLRQIARLWAELDDLEGEIKARKTKSK